MFVIETTPGQFVPAHGGETLTSVDGMRRAPVATLISTAFTDTERAAFRLHRVAAVAPPPGKRAKPGAFERVNAEVRPVFEDVPVPQQVSRRQLFLALHGAGKLAEIEAFVAGHPDAAVHLSWTNTATFFRTDPLLNAMAPLVGLTAGQVDQLFRAADAL